MIFHSLLAARLIIFPTSITIDRGKDYMSKVFMDACEYLQIDVVRANPRTPTDKPHIERTFAAINSGFTQFLNGYVGQHVVRRGSYSDQEAVITLQQAQDLLDGPTPGDRARGRDAYGQGLGHAESARWCGALGW